MSHFVKRSSELLIIFILFFVFFSQASVNQKYNSNSKKKIIYLGWELPTTQILSANFKMMEETSNFDGVTLIVRDTIGDVVINEDMFFSKHEIKKEWLRKSIERIKTCKFTKFTDNFVRITTMPKSLKWTDDKGWATIASNMSNLAWMAKKSGLKGISYDPESYNEKLFQWEPACGLSYDESLILARRRGRELMSAMGKEYPDITFFGLFMLSLGRSAIDNQPVYDAFSADVYALYPSFIDGMLDVLPPEAKIVEGNEDGYYCANKNELMSLYVDSKNKLLGYVTYENKKKFQTQYSVGLGLYLDMFSNATPRGRFYFGEIENRSRIERFRDILQNAVEISDEYVWVYSERYRWWNIPYTFEWYNEFKSEKLWKDIFPAIQDYVEYAKNPIEFIASKIENKTSISGNLIINGSFDEQVPKARNVIDWYNNNCPAGYLMWSADTLKSKIELAANEGVNGSSCAKFNIKDCHLIQQVKVIPGEQYIIAVDGRKSGGNMNIGVYWMDQYTNLIKWFQWKYFAFKPVKGNNWSTAIGLVTVPDDISSMQLLIRSQQFKSNDTFWVDNIRVFPLKEIFTEKK